MKKYKYLDDYKLVLGHLKKLMFNRHSDVIEKIRINKRHTLDLNDIVSSKYSFDKIKYGKTYIKYRIHGTNGVLNIKIKNANKLEFYTTENKWISFKDIKRLHDLYIELSGISKEEYNDYYKKSDNKKYVKDFIITMQSMYESEWLNYNYCDLNNIFIKENDGYTYIVMDIRYNKSLQRIGFNMTPFGGIINKNEKHSKLAEMIFNSINSMYRLRNVSSYTNNTDRYLLGNINYNDSKFNFKSRQRKLDKISNDKVKITKVLNRHTLLLEVSDKKELANIKFPFLQGDNYGYVNMEELCYYYFMQNTLLKNSCHQLHILCNIMQIAIFDSESKVIILLRHSTSTLADNKQQLLFDIESNLPKWLYKLDNKIKEWNENDTKNNEKS